MAEYSRAGKFIGQQPRRVENDELEFQRVGRRWQVIGRSNNLFTGRVGADFRLGVTTSAMEHFIAYHSAQRMGYDYGSPGALTFLSKKLGLLKKAIGNTVWVVQGTPDGRKTAYTLCGAYVADSIAPESPSSNVYVISGSQGNDFVPPVPLNQLNWFPALLKSQSNFSLGFNRLSDEAIILALSALQSENSTSPSSSSLPDIDIPTSVSEGERRLVSHLQRERKRAVVEAKKAAVLSSTGCLSCEACGFDFSAIYGSLGEGFCEVHHLSPLSASDESVTTTLADLAVLCSNCHRIIHRSNPMLSVAELSAVVRNGHPQPGAQHGRCAIKPRSAG